MLHLLLAIEQEVAGMLGRDLTRFVRIIGVFRV